MHPIAFHLGPLTVHWYGIMVALAFVSGLWTATRRAPLNGIEGEKIADLVVPWVMVGVILGARGVYVVTYWREQFANDPFPEIFMIHHGGIVFYGGFIGAVITVMIYSKVRMLPMWKLGDILTPSLALGYIFGRIGCLMNGCCYGRACSLPWAIRYPEDNPLHPPTFLVHPTQIYDALFSLGLYVALEWLYRRKKFDGQVFAVYLMCYAVTRSVVETFRGDYSAAHLHAGLTPAHWISIASFAAGAILFWKLPRANAAKK